MRLYTQPSMKNSQAANFSKLRSWRHIRPSRRSPFGESIGEIKPVALIRSYTRLLFHVLSAAEAN
jgi:hypothetical protein